MVMSSMPEWKCPAWTQNASLVNTSSPVFIEVWQSRMQTVSQVHKHRAFTVFSKEASQQRRETHTSVELMINSPRFFVEETKHIVVIRQRKHRDVDVDCIAYCVPVHSCRALSWWPLFFRSSSVSLVSLASSCASLAPSPLPPRSLS